MAQNNSRVRIKNGMVKVTFTQLSHHIIEDHRINSNAKIMLAYLLSKDDDWEFYRQDIQKRLGIAKTAYLKARDQLYEYGYLEFTTTNKGTDFIYFERPDFNAKYVNGINENGDRKVEFSPLLQEIREKEEQIGMEEHKKKKAPEEEGPTKKEDHQLKHNHSITQNDEDTNKKEKKLEINSEEDDEMGEILD